MGQLLYIIEQFKDGEWKQTFWTNWESGHFEFSRPRRVTKAAAEKQLKKAQHLYPQVTFRLSKPFEVLKGKR